MNRVEVGQVKSEVIGKLWEVRELPAETVTKVTN